MNFSFLTKFNLCNNYLQTIEEAISKINTMFLSGPDNLLGCLGFEEDKHVPKTVVWEVIFIFSATLTSLAGVIVMHSITPDPYIFRHVCGYPCEVA